MKILCGIWVAMLVLAASPPSVRGSGWESSSRLPATYRKPLASDPMKVTVHRLSNGLTVYLSPNALEPRITAWIAVRAGGAQDAEDSTGMAHYLEHMLFKGSRRLGTLDFEREKPHLDQVSELYEKLFHVKDKAERDRIYHEIDQENQKASAYAANNEVAKAYKRLGIKGLNAFTGSERTAYICDMPKNRLEAWAKLESDRFAEPVFRLFQTEIETVYEEKNRSLDNPDRILGEAFDKALFGEHPYGRTVLGSIAHLKNPSLAKMYAFYDRYYQPNNMAILLSGDFEREEALATIEKHFNRWTPQKIPVPQKRSIPTPLLPKRVEVRYEAEEQIAIGWHTVEKNHKDADALKVMSLVCDNGESGRINLDLIQGQKLKKAGAYHYELNEGGVWGMWGVPKTGQTLKEVETLLMETVKTVKDGGFSQDDLRAIVTNYEIAQKEALESNGQRVRMMMDAFVGYQDWAYHVDHLQRIRKVTHEDVVRVAKKYLKRGRVIVTRVRGTPEIPSIEKPAFSKVDIDPSRESPFLREVVDTPAREIQPRWITAGKDYESRRLDAGHLFAAANPVNDLFEMSFRFDRGRRHERGLCAALSLWELSGAGERAAADFKKDLYRTGVRFSASCGAERSSVTLRGPEEYFDEALRLMRLRFSQPNVGAGTLARMIDIELGRHKDNRIDPRYISHALSEYAQRAEESEVLSELSVGELTALTEEQLVGLLQSFFDYERRVTYIGVRTPRAVAKVLNLPDRTYRPAPERTVRRYVRPESSRVLFVHRDMVQAQVGLYAADEVFRPENYVDYGFFGTYMGGGMSSVIFQEVREARALAYSARGGYAAGRYAGDENLMWGQLGTQADKTAEATTLLQKLLRRLPESYERFSETKKSIIESYRTDSVKFRAIPATVIGWRDRGILLDPRPERLARAQEYGLAELVGFGKRFREAPLTFYILGDRKRVDVEALQGLGVFSEKSIDNLFPY